MNKQDLIKLFTEACLVNSPSGEELLMSKWIKSKISSKKWNVWSDNSGKTNDSNTGNIYAYLEVNPKFETIAFAAHMDTVASKKDKIKVLFDGKTFKSSGQTILGADNKVGVCTLLSLLDIDGSKLKSNLLLFFPTREETGMMGSGLFEFKKSKIKYVFNIDGGGNPGVFVFKSLGFQNFRIEIEGLATHAAQNYESGRNAIVAAAELVTTLPNGRNMKEGWTFNIGTISGGEKTNIVCDKVTLNGEFRAFNEKKMGEIRLMVKEKISDLDKKYGTDTKLYIDTSSYCPPLDGNSNSQIITVCKNASKELGIDPVFDQAFYSSDANNFSGLGLETIIVSRGGKNAHSKNEEVELSDIIKACDLVQKLAHLS